MDAYYSTLEHDALLHLSGPDSLTFLQGQTTCDTDNIDESHALPGAYCTPKGRMVCDFLLCQLADNHYGLRMRADIVPSSAAAFGKYIVFSKADLDTDGQWLVLSCWGSEIRTALAAIFPELPSGQFGAVMGAGFTLVQVDTTGGEFECYLSPEAAPDLIAQLQERVIKADESNWQALQIGAGMGRIETATVGEFIPQMLNFDITGHVSFTKGCYTGQEVVARMHYRGKPKRRMYLASLADADLPAAGTPLFTGDSEQSVGTVVNSALHANGSCVTLVVATRGGVEGGLHCGSKDGPLLQLGSLPYSMDKP